MTPNNDTPQISGEDARHDTVSDTGWGDRAGDQDPAGSGPLDDPDGSAVMDAAEEAEPYLPWAGWHEPAQQEAGDPASPPPSCHPAEPEYQWEPGYATGS